MQVVIEVDVRPVLSYALAHNQIAPVRGMTVRSSIDCADAMLTVEVRDSQGAVSLPFSQALDLAAGRTYALPEPDVRLDAATMLQITERGPATVIVEVRHGADVLGRSEQPTLLLAGKQWQSVSSPLCYELLASFAQPNDPATQDLVREARVLLEGATGSGSFTGYQTGSPERVDETVEAVWKAIQARSVAYSLPPASWTDDGQKVRNPQDVLDNGGGTCLDLTLVFAAALESVGIRPLLWVLNDHAFAGYWRYELALEGAVVTDLASVTNQVHSGRIRLVETTLVTKQTHPVPFEAAQAHACGLLDALTRQTDRDHTPSGASGDRKTQRFEAVVDIWVARKLPVIPLPATRVDAAGGVQVIEYTPPPRVGGDFALTVPVPVLARERAPKAQPAPARFQQWKNSLLDLTARNRLIQYPKNAGVRLVVAEPDFARFKDEVRSGQGLTLHPSDAIDAVDRERGAVDATGLTDRRLSDDLVTKRSVFVGVPEKQFLARLQAVAHKARTVEEETGANNLYLALGSLVWDLDGKTLRSPLILLPVRLSSDRRNRYRLEADEAELCTPNYCLLEKLRLTHGLELPGLAEIDDDLDLDGVIEAIRLALLAKSLPFRVETTVDLAVLQFAKFRLWKDIDDHWESMLENPLVRHLVETPTVPFVDPCPPPAQERDLDALDAVCPVPADASQLAAVAAAVHGSTSVLEGPPGTGKSQTITNMLSRAVAEGRRVLFVAEKRAALDVVAARLGAIGMAPFCLDLHDKSAKPTAVRAQIKKALEHAVKVDTEGLAVAGEELRSSRHQLSLYASRLHERNKAGYSYYSARTALIALGADLEPLPAPRHVLFDETPLAEIKAALQTIADVADPALPAPGHPWGFVGLTEIDQAGVERIRGAVSAVDEHVQDLPAVGPLAAALAAARTPEDLLLLRTLVDVEISAAELDATRREPWRASTREVTQGMFDLVNADHQWLEVIDPTVLALSLDGLHSDAEAAERSSVLGRGHRRRVVAAQMAGLLLPGATLDPQRVLEVTTVLRQMQHTLREIAERAAAIPGVRLPDSWNPFSEQDQRRLTDQIETLQHAGTRMAAGTPFTSAVRTWLDERQFSPDAAGLEVATLDAVAALAAALKDLGETAQTTDERWLDWTGGRGLVEAWTATAGRRRLSDPDLLPLRRWVTFQQSLVPLRTHGAHAASAALESGAVHAVDAVRAFERGLALESLAERRETTGLEGFDPMAHDKVVERFTASAAGVRAQLPTAIPAQVLTARPFASTTDLGRVGELQRELGRRRGLSVRALMAQYGDLITQVMPCVLVSPDSVSRFFPVGAYRFDTVVFDEASQIQVADAVGAMGRARSVVVVGDSKQMPPTSFLQPAVADDEGELVDGLVVEDEESILSEAVLAQVPRHWLTWHYRSQEESLIAFSNAHYYDNKLSSFPAPTEPGTDRLEAGVGLSLVRVDGTFLRKAGPSAALRTNPVEAAAIVDEVRRRFDATPQRTPSIGVITFNQPQRSCIESLIRLTEDQRLIEALDRSDGEGLFVKNLENVQGDERDVILFSTAFSANDRGELPLNFGPLSRAGGERRLNVAVTRARRQVILFASFDPEQLRVGDTQSVGVRHLRAYLELAASGDPGTLPGDVAAPVTDRHRDEIAARLRERGLVVGTDVGLSDFRVDLTVARSATEPLPVLAVLLDGPDWAARRTVGDRDGLPVQVLGKLMGWPAVERVWLPEWLATPEAVLDRLSEVAARAERVVTPEPEPEESPALGDDPVRVTFPSPTSRKKLRGAVPFVPHQRYHAGLRQVLDNLPSPGPVNRIRPVIENVVNAEGPVHVDRLAVLVAACFDLDEPNGAQVKSIVKQIPGAFLVEDAGDTEVFAWPTTVSPAQWTRFRPSSQRPLKQVCLREIGNAMVALCRQAAGMARDELLAETFALFGTGRQTGTLNSRLEAALDLAVSRGKLHLALGRFESSV